MAVAQRGLVVAVGVAAEEAGTRAEDDEAEDAAAAAAAARARYARVRAMVLCCSCRVKGSLKLRDLQLSTLWALFTLLI